jgi:hypothetical protein
MVLLTSISDNIVLVTANIVFAILLVLALASGGAEVALLALPSTSHARGVVGVVDAA